MLESRPAPRPKPSLIERMEPPRAVLPRWVNVLLGTRPQSERTEPPPQPAENEQRGVPSGPPCRCSPR
jgi:hypothetical protein